MRQIGAENSDPLKRIQAEINEVEQREREHRQKLANAITMLNQSASCDYVDKAVFNRNQQAISPDQRTLASTPESKDSSCDYISGLSDDSGISSASSPINGHSSNVDADEKEQQSTKQQSQPQSNEFKPKYIRQSTVRNVITANSNPYKSIYAPGNGTAPSKIITRTTSTPQIFVDGMQNAPRFQISPAKKGLMQRFIAARGKIALSGTLSGPIDTSAQRVRHFSDDDELTGSPNELDVSFLTSQHLNRQPAFMALNRIKSQTTIERDAQGKPIRRGFIPVEEKIQKELRDMQSRESELKRMRQHNQLRQSQPNLLSCMDLDDDGSDKESVDGDLYPMGKLRSSKSISELCDTLIQNASLSPSRETPSPQCQRAFNRIASKPQRSLAELCDVDPNTAPSSHRLIAQWESIIQRSQ